MYGLEIVVGEFGAGKTFYTHRRITGWGYRHTIRVGNYSSPDFHLQFRSIKDLLGILQAIYDYKKDPVNLSQEIVIVIDEASLYFGNREFKEFPRKMLSFLVQLRKLNVHAIIILQDLKMGDINFRRLCYNVRKYYTIRIFSNFSIARGVFFIASSASILAFFLWVFSISFNMPVTIVIHITPKNIYPTRFVSISMVLGVMFISWEVVLAFGMSLKISIQFHMISISKSIAIIPKIFENVFIEDLFEIL